MFFLLSLEGLNHLAPSPLFCDTMTTEFNVQSRTNLETQYTISVTRWPLVVKCNCKGFRIRGKCEHTKFYKPLIKAIIRESPGVTDEKQGF